ncbi:MAG: PrgI family protein [Parcubacteria bacterium OLB19]|nr:MAG: PrgI family protein [Parcubacteria bacterium OLB19]
MTLKKKGVIFCNFCEFKKTIAQQTCIMYQRVMRFEVPQFIDIEDKIFGPLTWRQFLYLGGGVGMAVVLFFTTPFVIFLFLGLPLGLLAAALAFYPVNNRPFSFFLEAVLSYIGSNKLYLWRKKDEIIHKNSFTPTLAGRKDPEPHQQNLGAIQKRNVNSLARRLELEALQKKE